MAGQWTSRSITVGVALTALLGCTAGSNLIIDATGVPADADWVAVVLLDAQAQLVSSTGLLPAAEPAFAYLPVTRGAVHGILVAYRTPDLTPLGAPSSADELRRATLQLAIGDDRLPAPAWSGIGELSAGLLVPAPTTNPPALTASWVHSPPPSDPCLLGDHGSQPLASLTGVASVALALPVDSERVWIPLTDGRAFIASRASVATVASSPPPPVDGFVRDDGELVIAGADGCFRHGGPERGFQSLSCHLPPPQRFTGARNGLYEIFALLVDGRLDHFDGTAWQTLTASHAIVGLDHMRLAWLGAGEILITADPDEAAGETRVHGLRHLKIGSGGSPLSSSSELTLPVGDDLLALTVLDTLGPVIGTRFGVSTRGASGTWVQLNAQALPKDVIRALGAIHGGVLAGGSFGGVFQLALGNGQTCPPRTYGVGDANRLVQMGSGLALISTPVGETPGATSINFIGP